MTTAEYVQAFDALQSEYSRGLPFTEYVEQLTKLNAEYKGASNEERIYGNSKE